jgi:hypothetical protein
MTATVAVRLATAWATRRNPFTWVAEWQRQAALAALVEVRYAKHAGRPTAALRARLARHRRMASLYRRLAVRIASR